MLEEIGQPYRTELLDKPLAGLGQQRLRPRLCLRDRARATGPDEVHRNQIARLEFYQPLPCRPRANAPIGEFLHRPPSNRKAALVARCLSSQQLTHQNDNPDPRPKAERHRAPAEDGGTPVDRVHGSPHASPNAIFFEHAARVSGATKVSHALFPRLSPPSTGC